MQKTVLITGAAQRVGRSISLGLAKAGYTIVAHYNSSSSDADDLVEEIKSTGGEAIAVQADLTDRDQTRKLLPKVISHVGPVELLINNASLFEEDGLGAIDDDIWDNHFSIHVKAPSVLASEFAKQNLESGLIINMIDERVWKLTPNFTSYTLSKSALWTATKTMAQALAPKIRVNAIGPGPTLPSARQTQQEFEAQVNTLLLKRAPDLDEFVNTILYFEAAKSVTGQMIALDGGQHLGWQTPDQRLPE